MTMKSSAESLRQHNGEMQTRLVEDRRRSIHLIVLHFFSVILYRRTLKFDRKTQTYTFVASMTSLISVSGLTDRNNLCRAKAQSLVSRPHVSPIFCDLLTRKQVLWTTSWRSLSTRRRPQKSCRTNHWSSRSPNAEAVQSRHSCQASISFALSTQQKENITATLSDTRSVFRHQADRR